MRPVNRTVARNLLLFVGAFYLSVLLGMPFFFAFSALTEGRIYEGPTGGLVSTLVAAVPLVVQDIIAALLAGWLLQSSAHRRWAFGFGLFLFVVHLMSFRWHITPTLTDWLHVLPGHVIPAAIAVPVFLFAARRFRASPEAA